ncbi:hypothetical protein EGJ22_20045 [Pseudomonas sp. p99-361]|nr:hypothetical protein G1E_35160 [Pseudomonas sp. TJI-51]OAK59061.1 hypothetical protein A3K88_20965 [Pseudomonas putida]PPB13573.1 hypothetical protein HV87_02035 [Pseudomonas aeruginosa]RRV11063.1 hypothetical protein EGJ22_20045 [Pseudomonas sp. p99-361]
MIQSLFSLLAWRRGQVLETVGNSAPLDSKVRQPPDEFKPFRKINFLLHICAHRQLVVEALLMRIEIISIAAPNTPGPSP